MPTRDHTELALSAFGATVRTAHGTVELRGGQTLQGVELTVPGDISSAAFWAVAAAALPGSDVEIEEVGLNRSRTDLLDVLRRTGARVDLDVERTDGGEPRGRIRIRHGSLEPLKVGAAEVPGPAADDG